jgi:hypothetical protein
MAKKKSTAVEFEIQGKYGSAWECVTTEETKAEALKRLKEYNENEPMYAHRLVRKKLKQVI